MESLEKRSASPCLALKAPVATDLVDELGSLGKLEALRVLNDAVEDECRDEGRARGVALLVRASGLARLVLEDKFRGTSLAALEDDAVRPASSPACARARSRSFLVTAFGTRTGRVERRGRSLRRDEPLRVLLAVRLELAAFATLLHLEFESPLARAGHVEGREAAAVRALDAGADSLAAEVADLGKVSHQRSGLGTSSS